MARNMQCIIFHGSFGSKDGNWFPWLKKALEKQGHEVFLEQFPVDDWDEIEKKGRDNNDTKQNLRSWLEFFSKNILPDLDVKKEIVIFGHSLSPVFILHVVDKYNLQLKGAVFVSPFLNALVNEKTWHFDVVNRTFFKTDFDWNKLKKLIPHSTVLYGTKDPYVPNNLPITFAHNLGSELIAIEDGKHLGGELTEFPLLLELFKKISK